MPKPLIFQRCGGAEVHFAEVALRRLKIEPPQNGQRPQISARKPLKMLAAEVRRFISSLPPQPRLRRCGGFPFRGTAAADFRSDGFELPSHGVCPRG